MRLFGRSKKNEINDHAAKRKAWELMNEKQRVCPSCRGSRMELDKNDNPITCRTCNGAGVT